MKKLLTLTALGTIMCCAQANASGFMLREQSVSAMGNAFAGATAGAEDISYSFYNPAGITRHKGTQINLNGTAIVGYVKGYDAYSNAAPNRYDDRLNHVVNRIILPSGYVTHQLNDKFTAGITTSAPFGLVTDYSNGWVGSNHGTLSDVATYNMTPIMAYKANQNLSVAAGVQIQYIDAELRNSAGRPRLNNNARLQGDTTDVGYILGGLYEFNPSTRIGAGYRSEIKHKLKGDIRFDNSMAIPAMGINMLDQSISARLTTPAMLNFGVYHDINEKWAIMAEAQKTYWSSFENLTIIGERGLYNNTYENWKDVWFYSIGANYKVNDQWKLRVGLAYDQAPVNERFRTPRIPDSDRIWHSFGAEYKLDDKWTFNGGYTWIRAEKSTVNIQNDPSRGDLYTRYKGNMHLFGLSFNYNF